MGVKIYTSQERRNGTLEGLWEGGTLGVQHIGDSLSVPVGVVGRWGQSFCPCWCSGTSGVGHWGQSFCPTSSGGTSGTVFLSH